MDSELEGYSFNEIEEYIEDRDGIKIDFKNMVYDTVTGEQTGVINDIIKIAAAKIKGETYKTINGLKVIIVAAILGGFLKNIISSFGGSEIGEIGFNINYMIVVGLGIGAFLPVISEMSSYCYNTVELAKSGLPLVLTAITASGNPSGAIVYNGLVTVSCAAVESFISAYIVPALSLCGIINVVNKLSKEAILEKLYGTAKKCMEFCIKAAAVIFTFAAGLNGAAAGLGENVLKKGTKGIMEMIPVAGGIINGSADISFSLLNSIKSGIGIVFIGVIIALSILPVLRIMITAWAFKIIAGIVEPVTDKRITEFLDEMGELSLLALSIMFLTGYIFIFGIAIFAAITVG